MQSLTKTCYQCGKEFTAERDSAKYCSDACRQASHRGTAPALPPEVAPVLFKELPPVGQRLYILRRGPTQPYERVIATAAGGPIMQGPYRDKSMGWLMRKAADQGWLVWYRRDDGWYAAEWTPERGKIYLTGPCQPPTDPKEPLNNVLEPA